MSLEIPNPRQAVCIAFLEDSVVNVPTRTISEPTLFKYSLTLENTNSLLCEGKSVSISGKSGRAFSMKRQ